MATQQFEYTSYFSEGNAPQKVNVEGINYKALSGIIYAIQKSHELMQVTNARLSQQQSTLDEQNRRSERDSEEQDKRNKSEETEKKQQLNRDRAMQAALSGQIDKATDVFSSFKQSLKDLGERIIGVIKDLGKQSLRSYDDTARGLRKQFLTTAEMKTAMDKADKASALLAQQNITVTSKETKALLNTLTSQGVDVRNLTSEQMAGIAAQVKVGKDALVAYKEVSKSSNPVAQAKIAQQMADATGRETWLAMSKLVADNQVNSKFYQERLGLSETEFQKKLAADSKRMDSVFGNLGVSADEQASVMQELYNLEAGNISNLDPKVFEALGVAPDVFANTEDKIGALLEGMKSKAASGGISSDAMLALQGAFGKESKLLQSFSLMQSQMEARTYTEKKMHSEQENIDAFNQNSPGGRAGTAMDKIVSRINLATGGMFSKISAGVNEMFGDTMGLEDIVSIGMKTIVTLLTTVATSVIIGNPFKLITSAIGLLGPRGRGTGGRSVVGESGTPADRPVNSLDNEYRAAVESIKGWGKDLSVTFSGIKGKILAPFEGIKTAFHRATTALSATGEPIRLSFKDVARRIGRTFADVGKDIGKHATIAFSKFPGILKSAARGLGKVGKGLAIGAGALGVIGGLLGGTGAFDSLQPILEDFAKTMAPVINDLMTSLAPVIKNLLDTIAPILTDLIASLAPILTDIMKALAPVLEALLSALVPIVKVVLDILCPIIKVIADVLSPILKIISSVLSVMSPVIKTIFEYALKPLMWVLKLITWPLEQIAKFMESDADKKAKEASAEAESAESEASKAASAFEEALTKYGANDPKTRLLGIIKAKTEEIAKQKKREEAKAKARAAFGRDANADDLFKHLGTGKRQQELEKKKEEVYKARESGDSGKLEAAQKELEVEQLTTMAMTANAVTNTNYVGASEKDIREKLSKMTPEERKELRSKILNDNDYKKAIQNLESTGYFDEGEFKTLVSDTSSFNERLDKLSSEADALQKKLDSGKTVTPETAADLLIKVMQLQTDAAANTDNDFLVRAASLENRVSNVIGGQAIAQEKARIDAEKKNKPAKERAFGGLVSSPEIALIGEDGREAVLPLTKPDYLRRILQSLSLSDKLSVLESLFDNDVSSLFRAQSASVDSSDDIASSYIYDKVNSDGASIKERFMNILNESGLSDKATEFESVYNEAVKTAVQVASAESTKFIKQYIKQMMSAMNGSDRNQIISSLKEIITYLSGIARNNNQQFSRAPAQKVPAAVYGISR